VNLTFQQVSLAVVIMALIILWIMLRSRVIAARGRTRRERTARVTLGLPLRPIIRKYVSDGNLWSSWALGLGV
jgi:hypothetical protein